MAAKRFNECPWILAGSSTFLNSVGAGLPKAAAILLNVAMGFRTRSSYETTKVLPGPNPTNDSRWSYSEFHWFHTDSTFSTSKELSWVRRPARKFSLYPEKTQREVDHPC